MYFGFLENNFGIHVEEDGGLLCLHEETWMLESLLLAYIVPVAVLSLIEN